MIVKTIAAPVATEEEDVIQDNSQVKTLEKQ
jgi:hypothetical protein